MFHPEQGDRGRAERRRITVSLGVEPLEGRTLLAGAGSGTVATTAAMAPELTTTDVRQLLDRASAATASRDGIIAVMDRNGRVLGVRVEDGVSPAITGDRTRLVFAIDGALAEARTGAFFGNNQAPLTSRTIQFISQSTITQGEVNSNPDLTDPNSPQRGPGLVAPIGIKAHFPPGVQYTPQVDLFQIELTNRDSIVNPGPDQIRQGVGAPGSDDVLMAGRFNINNANPNIVPPGQQITAPESYGFLTGMLPAAQSRGIGTLPGGIPLVKGGSVVGGIGVFFPGTTGFASEENSKLNDPRFFDPTKPDRSVEAEYIAFAAAGGSQSAGVPAKTFTELNAVVPPVPGFDLPSGRIDLVGITLDLFGPDGLQGVRSLIDYARQHLPAGTIEGQDVPVDAKGDTNLGGQPAPVGWLVLPHDAPGGGLTAADVTTIIQRGITAANNTRAAIRLPLNSTAKMLFSVTDQHGNILGLYRMPDATIFSIDVAVAKARNVTYYADPAQLQPADQVPGVPKGTALTNRTFRYLAEPRFPEGIDHNPPGPFSILNDPGVAPTGVQTAPEPPSAYQSVLGHDAYNPQTNFHQPWNLNQNGIVFFPGSTPLYKVVNGVKTLVGGLGVSGDGVDQDDDVTYTAAAGFGPPDGIRADQTFVRGVRLPFIKFNRQPHVPVGRPTMALKVKPILPLVPPGRVGSMTRP